MKKVLTVCLSPETLTLLDAYMSATRPPPSRSAIVDHAVQLWLQAQLNKN